MNIETMLLIAFISVLDDFGHSVIEGIINNAEPVHAALTAYLARFQKRVSS